MGSIPIRGNEVFNIFISSLCCQGKERRWINTQCLQNSTRNGKWSVIELNSSKKWTTECLLYPRFSLLTQLFSHERYSVNQTFSWLHLSSTGISTNNLVLKYPFFILNYANLASFLAPVLLRSQALTLVNWW